MENACCAHCNKANATTTCSLCESDVYCNQKCASAHWIEHVCIDKKVSAKKAREILHHGSVRGHKLTEKQRRFFGYLSNQ